MCITLVWTTLRYLWLTLRTMTDGDSDTQTTGLIDLAEAASRLGVTIATTRRWVREGKLKGYKLGGRTYRLDPEDVKIFIRTHAVD